MAIFTDMGSQEVMGDYNIDPDESVGNQHPSYYSGGRLVIWNGTRYVYADAGQYGGSSPTDWAGVQAAQSGGSQVSGSISGGGGGGGGGGGSSDVADIAAQLRAMMDTGGSSTAYRNIGGGAQGIDTGSVLSRMDSLFNELQSRASQRADAAAANYRGAAAGANEYMRDVLAQGLSQRMVDEFSGRLRSAQAARGLSFGGAAATEEAALLTGIAEKNRQAVLGTALEAAKTEATLPASIEAAFMGSGAQAAQAATQQGAVLTDVFRAGIGGAQDRPVYQSVLDSLFG